MNAVYSRVPVIAQNKYFHWTHAVLIGVMVGALTLKAQVRSKNGLIALYDFSGKGNVIRDLAKGKRPLHLKISDMDAVRRNPGSMEVVRDVLIATERKALEISSPIKRSGSMTVEAWITPRDKTLRGPSRIVSLSKNALVRNFTLAQEGNRFDVRLMTSRTDRNGMPSLASAGGAIRAEMTHVVYTFGTDGFARIYLNGRENSKRKVGGRTSGWNEGFRLSLANENARDRAWRGTYHLVAIYNRALNGKEVTAHFRAGVRKPIGRRIQRASFFMPGESRGEPFESAVATANIALPVGGVLDSVDFERHVVPLFSRQGCNAGSCHGSFSGASDFQLSLFGHDPGLDYREIMDPDEGPRVEVDDVMQSFLIRKPSGLRRHRGGKRFETNSWQFEIIKAWVSSGANRKEASGKLDGVKISPDGHVFGATNELQQLRVTAFFKDGSTEDVTSFCKFDTQDDYVAEVSDLGEVRSVRPGDTAVIISYRDKTISTRVYVPAPVYDGFRFPEIKRENYVDSHILSKLRRLNTIPSFHSSDGEFLRRVYIDTIGRVPNVMEAERFFRDTHPEKRDRIIDTLLSHPDHAALWATKMSDITGNDTLRLYPPAEKRSQMWHDWLRVRFEQNMPYDQIVRGILVATSREGRSEKEWIKAAENNDTSNISSFKSNYSNRETLDLFWKRKNLKKEQVGERVAAAFLGIRLQCARCHKHPYDRWTQVDYRAFAGLFGQVKVHNGAQNKDLVEENRRRKRIKEKEKRLPQLREVVVDPKSPRLMPHPVTRKGVPPAPLGAETLDGKGDYRRKLWTWMRDPENPLFAHNMVNRIWKHYFGIGIVEPVDDLSDANPPSHPHLLDSLARDFSSSGFDIRHIERRILESRAYQFSSTPNRANSEDRKNFARSYPRNLMAEVAVDVIHSALGIKERWRADAPEGSRAIDVAPSIVRDGDLRHAFRVFGRPTRGPVCDCERTTDPALPQTLHLMADADVYNKIRNGRLRQYLSGSALRRFQRGEMSDDEVTGIIRNLFLSTLTRYPDEREARVALDNVKQQGDGTGFTDIMWALVNTREFILNH